ncbi:MAG: winged helix-turn-helix transcriptional regulator [Francisellaceae bacterium]|jgi:DNA-binding MarR family transcriptional regulator|nr:winged helix-turn-helix transcriptional regulator [Francisellaceae bacterium]MBT6539303.1 winged helix-turn-helix transcriptional regulator [Francisellaceae bacterium]
MNENHFMSNEQHSIDSTSAHNNMASIDKINKECCCFNLRKVSRAITQYYDHALDSSGLRITQFTLLVALASTKAKTLTEIAESLVMDRTTLTRNLKPLEKMELISTVPSIDRRSKAYALTDKGREVFQKAFPHWEKAQNNMVKILGDEKYASIMADLDNLLELSQYPKDFDN